MILSMNWLSDHTDVSDIDIKKYCDEITLTGSKVEGYEVLAEDITGVVVGKVLSVAPHSNSDHLVICQVDVGESEPVQIVTGAPNVSEGALVPVARDGATLPGGINIKASKLRGETSLGMMCSIGELGLTLNDMPGAVEDGLLILNDVGLGDAVPGTDIKELLMMNDKAVEFEITSNRPDCLSVIGLARESAITFKRPMKEHKLSFRDDPKDKDDISNYLDVTIDNTEKCCRYSAKVVKNVKIAPSPLWMRMRLKASGVRPINNIVDITNYVMLEYCQPMHAFDYVCLDGKKIIVRDAKENENYKSLDDTDHVLDPTMLVISDEKKAVALAGIMGGANSEIKDTTTTVVFESAMFEPTTVRRTEKKLGMKTESSTRFEKGLDAENTVNALMRACELIEELGAGEVVNGLIDVYPVKKEIVKLPLEPDKINRFLGTSIARETMESILKELGFTVNRDSTITVPSWRDDVRNMNDVAEEIIRIYGYNDIESTIDHVYGTGMRTPEQAFEIKVKDMILGMGFDEIQTFSFISPKYYDNIRMPADAPERKSVVISNPLGEDTSVMRTTVIPSMLKVLADNNAVKNKDVRLFECGNSYVPTDENSLPDERKKLVLGFYSNSADKNTEGFYVLKGYVEAVLGLCCIRNAKFVKTEDSYTLHPGKSAMICAGDVQIGLLGEVHPEVAAKYGFTTKVYIAEFDLRKLYECADLEVNYKPIARFPAIERDFAFLCDEDMEIGTLSEEIAKAGGALVESVELFDVYRGHQLPAGKKSVAFSIQIRDNEKTLTDADADRITTKILTSLENNLGVTLRS